MKQKIDHSHIILQNNTFEAHKSYNFVETVRFSVDCVEQSNCAELHDIQFIEQNRIIAKCQMAQIMFWELNALYMFGSTSRPICNHALVILHRWKEKILILLYVTAIQKRFMKIEKTMRTTLLQYTSPETCCSQNQKLHTQKS